MTSGLCFRHASLGKPSQGMNEGEKTQQGLLMCARRPTRMAAAAVAMPAPEVVRRSLGVFAQRIWRRRALGARSMLFRRIQHLGSVSVATRTCLGTVWIKHALLVLRRGRRFLIARSDSSDYFAMYVLISQTSYGA